MATELIRFDSVVAGYGSLMVLNGLSFSARKGEVTLLIGPNGAGKSTVLKTLFGLLTPRQGEMQLDGQRVNGLPPDALLRRGVAFVPQGRNLFPSLTLHQNLELGGITLPRADRRARLEEALEQFPQLAARLHSPAAALSGGEQKQLEIARALQLRPSVLLIDEPSIGLSPKINQTVFRLLRSLADTGVSVLMVEQNVRSALQVSDRVLVLEGGRLVQDCPATTLIALPNLNEIFLGRQLRE